jgi:hypothetical protein
MMRMFCFGAFVLTAYGMLQNHVMMDIVIDIIDVIERHMSDFQQINKASQIPKRRQQ